MIRLFFEKINCYIVLFYIKQEDDEHRLQLTRSGL